MCISVHPLFFYLKMFLFTVYLSGLFYNNPPEIALCIRIYMRNLCDTCIFVLLETASPYRRIYQGGL